LESENRKEEGTKERKKKKPKNFKGLKKKKLFFIART